MNRILIFFLLLLFFGSACQRQRSQTHEIIAEEKIEEDKPKDALTEYNRAIELDRDNGELYRKRGLLKFDLGDLVGALSDLNTADAKNAADAETYKIRADIHVKNKELKLALPDYDKAIAMKPNYEAAYNNRPSTDVPVDPAVPKLY